MTSNVSGAVASRAATYLAVAAVFQLVDSTQAVGAGSLRDFRYFVSNVARLAGGVYLNCGSAVVLPEVFLKAVSLARNRGVSLDGLTTVNLDFVRHYRPETNVVARPPKEGKSVIAMHEIVLPLLHQALKAVSDTVARGGDPAN